MWTRGSCAIRLQLCPTADASRPQSRTCSKSLLRGWGPGWIVALCAMCGVSHLLEAQCAPGRQRGPECCFPYVQGRLEIPQGGLMLPPVVRRLCQWVWILLCLPPFLQIVRYGKKLACDECLGVRCDADQPLSIRNLLRPAIYQMCATWLPIGFWPIVLSVCCICASCKSAACAGMRRASQPGISCRDMAGSRRCSVFGAGMTKQRRTTQCTFGTLAQAGNYAQQRCQSLQAW